MLSCDLYRMFNIYHTIICMSSFKLHSDYKPAGDQPEAIKKLVDGLERGHREKW